MSARLTGRRIEENDMRMQYLRQFRKHAICHTLFRPTTLAAAMGRLACIHPRQTTGLPDFEKKVLATVRKFRTMHPRVIEAHLGRDRVVNAWGGYSKATTRALEDLLHRGLLRIARRENGIRVESHAIRAIAVVRRQSLNGTIGVMTIHSISGKQGFSRAHV